MRIGWGDPTFWNSPHRLILIGLLCTGGFLMACLTASAAEANGEATGTTSSLSDGFRRLKMACFGAFWALFLVYLPTCDHADILVFPDGVWLIPLRYTGLVLLSLGGLLRLMAIVTRASTKEIRIILCAERAGSAGPATFVNGGVYRYIRHPEYLGILSVLLGFVFSFRSLWGLGIWLFWIGVIVVRIHREEVRLLQDKRENYLAYQARTWRLIPCLY